MTIKLRFFTILATLLFTCTGVQASPLGTSITYQGKLSDNGSAATDAYDVEFALYDEALAGSVIDTVSVPGLFVDVGLIKKRQITCVAGLFDPIST